MMKRKYLKPEEKELLMRDLLPRICTNVKVYVPGEEEPKELRKRIRWMIVYGRAKSLEDCLDGLIPYLRPLSSMTEEEKKELGIISCEGNIEYPYGTFFRCQDWLVSHHFDFRCLIQEGLALEAKEGIYDN